MTQLYGIVEGLPEIHQVTPGNAHGMNGNTTHFEVTAKARELVHIDGTPIPIKIVNCLCHIPNVTKDWPISRGVQGKVVGLVHPLPDTLQFGP
jgi:hypothetical protein